MKIAIIPARGGSKRIPRKNIKLFLGKPMIAWSIETAITSGLFDRVVVSTDDDEIKIIAKKYGAEVPFKRPKELAGDHIDTTPVITHAVNWAIEQGWEIDEVCCIYATAPFIKENDLIKGLEVLNSSQCDYVFAVTEYASSIFRSFVELPGGGVDMLFPENFNTRTQDLPVALHDAAQFYWAKASTWLNGEKIFTDKSQVIQLPKWRVQDIDSEDDWNRAEILAPLINLKFCKFIQESLQKISNECN